MSDSQARFDAIYNILKYNASWANRTLVEVHDSFYDRYKDYNTSDENGLIEDLKYARESKGLTDAPTNAPPGLSFCLYGAVKYVDGPTEEQIATSLALACIMASRPECTLKDIARLLFNEYGLFKDLTYRELGHQELLEAMYFEMYHAIVDDTDPNDLLGEIFAYNDDTDRTHKEVLAVIKFAKRLDLLIHERNGSAMANWEVERFLKRKL
jgi:hypothetical protein